MPAAALLTNADRTRQLVARARSRGHVPAPMPAYQPPDRIEGSYAARLRAMVGLAAERAYAPLIAALPALVAQARAERGDAADWRIDGTHSGKSASAAVRAAKVAMAGELSSPAVASEAKRAGQDVDQHSRGQVGKQVKRVLGIDLAGAANADQRALVTGFVHENVKLITGITPTLASEVERLVLAGLTGGQLHEMLAAAIRRRLQVSINRAELIAVDQIGKINGQVTAARHRALGVTRFKWITVGDERVRGNPSGLYPNAKPSHYDRNGKAYLYSDPPRGKSGELELPGVPIRCRCYAEPILDDLLGAPAGGAAPVAPGAAAPPVPTTEEVEAEAARLMREVEAMLARRVEPPLPVVKPAPLRAAIAQAAQEAAGGDQVGAVRAVAESYARASAAHHAALEARRAEDREHLDAVRAMNREPLARDVHEAFANDNFIDRHPMLVDEFRQLVRDNGFKRITVEELTHAFAPPPGMTAKIEELVPNGDNGPSISVAFYDAERNRVGRVTREFRPGGEINHAVFVIEEGAQGAGLSATVNGQSLIRYQKWGAREVTLDAAWVGRYAWARAGFEIDKGDHEYVLRAADQFIEEKIPVERQPAYKARVRELIHEPWRLAAWDDGATHDVFFDAGQGRQQAGSYPLGKALLLDHRMPMWTGRLALSDGDAGFKTALRSTRAKDRR